MDTRCEIRGEIQAVKQDCRYRAREFVSLFLIALFITGCLQPTAGDGPTGSVKGVWRYTAVQSDPLHETMDGSLTITDESGASFSGRLDVQVVTTQTGAVRNVSGPLTGTATIDLVDFDVSVSGTGRRHIGELTSNIIEGTWIQASPSGVSASGTFRAERQSR